MYAIKAVSVQGALPLEPDRVRMAGPWTPPGWEPLFAPPPPYGQTPDTPLKSKLQSILDNYF